MLGYFQVSERLVTFVEDWGNGRQRLQAEQVRFPGKIWQTKTYSEKFKAPGSYKSYCIGCDF